YESYIAYTAKDYGDGPYPADEVLYMDFFEWNELDESEQEGIFPLHTNQILADCPIIAPACRITVGELPEQPETVLASVRIVGPNNEDFIPYVRMGIEKGATLRELTNEVLALYGASASWNDWGFLNAINGCDIGEDYWMSMLNDSGDAFNTGTFDSITAEDGDVLVLYPYGNGNYAWLNAEEAAPVSVMDWEGTEYITGSASFTLSANSYDDNWNTVTAPLAGATVTVCEEGGEPIPQDAYKASLATLETDESGAFAIDFYGNCPAEDLEYYSYTYWLYAEKDGYNKAFCEVILTADGLYFSQPAPAGGTEEPDEPTEKDVDIDALMAGIAATYTEESAEWKAMEMGAYAIVKPDAESKLSDAAKQALINNAADKAADEKASDTDLAKAILALQANGYDPQQVYAAGSSDPQDLAAVLSKAQLSPNAWNAPYALAAFAQGDYGELPARDALLTAVLNAQAEDGSWEAFGATVDATANMLAGLAFYKDNADVSAAIEKAVDYLSSMQKDDGSFDAWGYGADANTQAIVVIGLAACGVDPAADERFVKGGGSALDALLVYALEDNTGFGYQDDKTLNTSSTEQGFRALLAVAGGLKNVYDYSGVSPLKPAKAGETGPSDEPGEPSGSRIHVTVSIKADDSYWLEDYRASISGSGATAYKAVVKALDDNSISYKTKNGDYIYTLTYNGRTLGELDAGPNSGWLYKVNGKLPTVGMGDCALQDGDKILFYFTEDWMQDPDAASNAGMGEPAEGKEKSVFIDVKNTAWYAPYAEKAAELGLMTGYAAGTADNGAKQYEFRGEEAVTRAQFAQVLYNMAGSPDVKAESSAWYAKAVAWAVEKGVMAGYYDGKMHEEDAITREQMAVMTYAYLRSILKADGEPDLALLEAFHDTPAPSDYAKDALAWLLGKGLMAGRGANRGIVALAPRETTTRAELAAFVTALDAFLK
nr:S-layer homology domain-containing protein [Clostridia bacterium]